MHATAVNPPATAAAVPVATVSLCSCPGSRRWTCISISPGQITRPRDISTTAASASATRLFPTRAIRPSSISTSNMPSRPLAGSMTRPPLSSRFDMTALLHTARQKVEHGHAHGDAVGDLLENDGIRTVGDLGRDLDPAIHRPRMHDDHVGLRALHALHGHPEDVEV